MSDNSEENNVDVNQQEEEQQQDNSANSQVDEKDEGDEGAEGAEGDSKSDGSVPLQSLSSTAAFIVEEHFPKEVWQTDEYAWNPAAGRITVWLEGKESGDKKRIKTDLDSALNQGSDVVDLVESYRTIPTFMVVLEQLGWQDDDGGLEPELLNNVMVEAWGNGADKEKAEEFGEPRPNTERVKCIVPLWTEEVGVCGFDPNVWSQVKEIDIRGEKVTYERSVQWFKERGVEIEDEIREPGADLESMGVQMMGDEAEWQKDLDPRWKELYEQEKASGGVLQVSKTDMTRALCKEYKPKMLMSDDEMKEMMSEEMRSNEPYKLLQLDDWYAGNGDVYCNEGFFSGYQKCKCARHPHLNPVYRAIAECIAAKSTKPYEKTKEEGTLPEPNIHWSNWPEAGFHK